MNDALQQAVVQLIKDATSGVKEGISFLSSQLPDVIHQLLVWKFTISLISFLVCFSAIIGFCVFYYIFCKRNRWDEDAVVVGFVILTAAEIVPVLFLCRSFDWLKIWLAPKVYLIEYAASLVK